MSDAIAGLPEGYGRVPRVVDRRFNRARYNADQVIDAFAVRLRDAVDLGVIRDELTRTVHDALEPAHLSLWIKEDRTR